MVIRGVTALCAAGVGLTVASDANAQLLNHRDLSLATALAIATAASDHCKARGYHVSVAVVGREAQVIVQLRGDQSPPHSAENSYRRAYTALPVVVGGDTIGAVAASGSPGGDKDEACAREGLDKVADQLK